MINPDLARKLLSAADEQPYGFLKVKGDSIARAVERLAQEGYVEATVQPGATPPVAVINRLTRAGERLLRVLRDAPRHRAAERAHSDTAILEQALQ